MDIAQFSQLNPPPRLLMGPGPINADPRVLRAQAIYAEDAAKSVRKSHENPSIMKLYEEYFEKPNSHKAHELLHTHYTARPKYK